MQGGVLRRKSKGPRCAPLPMFFFLFSFYSAFKLKNILEIFKKLEKNRHKKPVLKTLRCSQQGLA